ncbi:membrane protein [Terriglobus saanensis]|uniref:Putative integral membrane protein n=1 Tax=Terriglobus saanensis (strain ATCC BAA-1853 / DSM 23119 / SP1PR4) TaxID=401053 RepID=E8UX95_TERSS|nr:membrane protein [Terriglobus saanensis]ADV83058.1 putative integral membrane protein [Terriglobus saanensis SP1PR4]
MYQPEAYWIALLLMIASMLCWGSWANTRKLTMGYAFSLFYWDYVIGIVLGSLVWGFTLGSIYGGPASFLQNLRSADHSHVLFAILGGVIFNIANLLLVAAIDIAGMAVAFPVGIGLALIVGVVLNYLIQPTSNPLLIFGGVALVAVAIVLDALAYKRREAGKAISKRGVVLSVVSGVLMGSFYPFVARSSIGTGSLGPYAVAFVFAVGVALCSLPLNAWLMKHSLTGESAVAFSEYRVACKSWHFWGMVGGLVWCTGAVASFVAARAGAVGPAVSYAIGQGATMISAFWGVVIWKEFASAPATSKRLIPWMFFFFLTGLGAIAVAPLIPR